MGAIRRRRQLRGRASAPPVDSMAISSEFPVLKAAYEAGERALISWIGDSTVANVIGTEETSTTWYLRQYLTEAGLDGVIGGCFSTGDKGLVNNFAVTVGGYAQFYHPDAAFVGAFAQYALERTAFGTAHFYTSTAGDFVRYQPGFHYDRVEAFHPTFTYVGGAGNLDLKIGATTVATLIGNQATGYRRTPPYSVARTDGPVDQVAAAGGSGVVWPGALRVWDSTASRILQVENLGVCGYRCSDWLATDTGDPKGAGMAAGSTVPSLGCHLAIIQLGVNEQNTGVSAATYQADLTALIEAFQAAGSDVLVCLPPPATEGWAMDADHRAAVPAACAAAGIGAPVDLYGGIGFTDSDRMDAVHPNAAGNHKIVNGPTGVGARILGLV